MTHCPVCDGSLVSISLQLQADLVMRSCSRCDQRFWEVDGKLVELSGLLGREPVRQPALR